MLERFEKEQKKRMYVGLEGRENEAGRRTEL